MENQEVPQPMEEKEPSDAEKKRRAKEAKEVQKIVGKNAERFEKERFRKILDKRLRGE